MAARCGRLGGAAAASGASPTPRCAQRTSARAPHGGARRQLSRHAPGHALQALICEASRFEHALLRLFGRPATR